MILVCCKGSNIHKAAIDSVREGKSILSTPETLQHTSLSLALKLMFIMQIHKLSIIIQIYDIVKQLKVKFA